MKIAHFGTFDVANYGDLLFPRLIEARLQGLADEIIHVSPVGGKRIYDDVSPARAFKDVRNEKLDAVIIGGGNILHGNSSSLPEYRNIKYQAYPLLWLSAAQLAARQKIPLIVNGSGVPRPFGRVAAPLMRAVAHQASYFAVRDKFSAEHLHAIGVERVSVVPDTALEISSLLGDEVADIKTARDVPNSLQSHEYASVHLNDRYVDQTPDSLASTLDELSLATNLRICLIAIGPCHGDDAYLEKVASYMRTDPFVYSSPRRVSSIASVIAASKMYLGSSLHGFITAASFKIPSIIVANHSAQHKFRGQMTQMSCNERLIPNWSEALEVAKAKNGGSKLLSSPVEVGHALEMLNQHWISVRHALAGGPRYASPVFKHGPDLSSAYAAQYVARAGLQSLFNRG